MFLREHNMTSLLLHRLIHCVLLFSWYFYVHIKKLSIQPDQILLHYDLGIHAILIFIK